MTDYEFGKAVMEAAGVAPCANGRHEFFDHAGRETNCICGVSSYSAPRGEQCPMRPPVYPDPLTPEGHCALWDALVAAGWRVEVHSMSDGVRVRLHKPTHKWSLCGHTGDTRYSALIGAAAQALGVKR